VWASGKVVDGIHIKNYHKGYFLTAPELFAKNHYPFEKQWFLNDSISNLEFKPETIMYAQTFDKQILPIVPMDLETKVKKNKVVHFKFKKLKNQTFKTIQLIYFSDQDERV